MASSSSSSSSSSSVWLPPLRLRGCAHFRQRVVFATLAGRRLRIDEIRHKDESPGLRDFEASFLRLVEKLTNGCRVEINETGTSLRYQPGVIVGGKVAHDCGLSRAVGYFLEGVLPLLPFAKKETRLALAGITNDDVDPSVDFLKLVLLPLLPLFGAGEGLALDVQRRGTPPLGGGLVQLTCPAVRELRAVSLTDEGFVKKVRGAAFTARVSPQLGNRLVDGARGILNAFLPDVFVTTDHNKGAEAGASPGYGVTLSATTTSGCVFGAQRASGRAPGVFGEAAAAAAAGAPAAPPDPPEDMGADAAALLLDEVARGGCLDTCAQPLAFALMVLGPSDVSRVRVGQIGPAGVATLRLIKDFFGVVFHLAPDVRRRSGPDAAAAAPEAAAGGGAGEEEERGGEAIDADALGAAGRKRRRNEGIEGARKRGAAPAAAAAPLVAGVSGGHSGRTVLVSCQGIGFRNLAKKVT